ncbi:MAG TPA: hypothetical protein VMV86_05655, partial [Methanosarcinales archaeon]|nr:hypothetical protein [Methanosarcinales archaeon]
MAGNPYNIDYYAGASLVDNNIPSSFRDYDRSTAYLTYIAEGRATLAKLLLQYAKNNGTYVAR